MATQALNTVVVGGGWAGLAAATTLSRYGMAVDLFESGSVLGGRARSVSNQDWHIDNGQHMMLGAYRNILGMLQTLGIPEHRMVKRKLLQFEMRSARQQTVTLHVHNMAAPMHLLWGLMRAKGLDLHERGTALRLGARLIRNRFSIGQDQPLEKWLLQHGQTRRLIQFLWQPLCLAMLNTPIRDASTQVFLRILRKHFAREREDSDLLFILPRLSDALPRHARHFIEDHGGRLHLQRRITGLAIAAGKLQGFYCGEAFQPCERLILATPPWSTQKLLSAHPQTRVLADTLAQFHHHPICTIYLQYPDSVSLGNDLIGLVDGIGHWVFDRRINGQPGLMAVVICGPGNHMTLDNQTLAQALMEELAALYPHWPPAMRWRVLREKRATFGCDAGIQQKRPEAKTAVEGLWLAGDYLNTGYPSTLEGAVKSGIMSARALLADDALDAAMRAS
ncbi:hypothetical protein Tel_08420 [Candidatus Tenderia electrophaga]|jgi:squalene-associated FAD-dependent desaturase|uniref:Amine oxidase domain-containing protein n=1 Tax=Candidatus Tenderia electrophaga TaxID=1748243 RepID=A0A0S2TDF6_9GAMM|nr:hypothetical protein Tel_08420 [Candidatus Tenderia electrophaga]